MQSQYMEQDTRVKIRSSNPQVQSRPLRGWSIRGLSWLGLVWLCSGLCGAERAALQFDVEQIDGRRVRNIGRKMAAEADIKFMLVDAEPV